MADATPALPDGQPPTLTDAERDLLLDAFCRHSPEGRAQVGHFGCEMAVREIVPAVERILANRTAVAR